MPQSWEDYIAGVEESEFWRHATWLERLQRRLADFRRHRTLSVERRTWSASFTFRRHFDLLVRWGGIRRHEDGFGSWRHGISSHYGIRGRRWRRW